MERVNNGARSRSNRIGVWTPIERRSAGVHAVVIGVSDYPYLGDGSAPAVKRAPDNGGLRQLEVCARTAARIFDWLNHAGSVAGAPLATVRLLLAPRPDEMADVNALTGGAYAAADFASVRGAIEDWADDIVAGNAAGGPNVAFFFFSGHGTEYMSYPALLASDILNPLSAGAGRKAVGFYSLCAVKTLGIDRALFFVDACRDVPAVARALNIVGEEILKPNPFPPRTHDSLICLQSTRTGGSAFQVPATVPRSSAAPCLRVSRVRRQPICPMTPLQRRGGWSLLGWSATLSNACENS
jgi:hypothetical protein